MIGIIAVCIDIAILIAIGSNPGYSAEARWACVALVALFSLPPLLWLFGATLSSWRSNGSTTAALNAVLALLPLASRLVTEPQGREPL